MALSVSWLDARLNKEKETVVKADRDGLSAQVSLKGTEIVFSFVYRFDGKQQRVDIGTYPYEAC